MLGRNFYNGLLRKYVAYFGALFSQISIDRVDGNNVVQQSMTVPVEFGPKERYLARAIQNPDLTREISMVLPAISYEIQSITYDPSRKLNTVDVLSSPNSTGGMYTTYNPLPWNINFRLTIICRNTEDSTRIVEQIIPFFTPNWTQNLNLIPQLNIQFAVPVILNTVHPVDTYKGNFQEPEFIFWDLDFTMQAWFFGPVSNTGGIIKETITNIFAPNYGITIPEAIGTANSVVTIDIKPGLTANGQPTTNAAASIPYQQINGTDDYGLIINLTETPNNG